MVQLLTISVPNKQSWINVFIQHERSGNSNDADTDAFIHYCFDWITQQQLPTAHFSILKRGINAKTYQWQTYLSFQLRQNDAGQLAIGHIRGPLNPLSIWKIFGKRDKNPKRWPHDVDNRVMLIQMSFGTKGENERIRIPWNIHEGEFTCSHWSSVETRDVSQVSVQTIFSL